MKSLDEVIDIFEKACDLERRCEDCSGCLGQEEGCPNDGANAVPDALHYLKMYRSDKAQYENDRENWETVGTEARKAYEAARDKHIAALKKLQRSRLWIPVSERMPENDHTMAVRTVTRKGVVSWNRAWWDGEFWHGSGSMANVTHWMPISTEVA